jgi:hypothetical protein
MEGIGAIFRVSVVRCLYASEIKRQTPSPFVEIRIFVFLKERPSPAMYQMIKERLGNKILATEKLFQSINHVKNVLQNVVYWEDDDDIHSLSVRKKADGVKVEIDGMEIERIDVEDAEKFFKVFKKRIYLGKEYRYVAFFGQNGEIKKEFDEDSIAEIEAETDMLDSMTD